ncbi:YhzD family protein [Bacillus siamensis]|uniref:YhzD family protein n=1 Tax=Bacillus siamensis TaxID=659243 RepID=UPI002E1E2CCF|nr:YhzD family protein [Bacillus siamensis]MED5097333.1 YhzD family protein [Bacillus siamensis]
MGQYVLTAFHASGEKLLDERIEVDNEAEAKAAGEALLKEKKLTNTAHRLVNEAGKLILFHR